MKELKEYRKEIFRRSSERKRMLHRIRLIALIAGLSLCLFVLMGAVFWDDWKGSAPQTSDQNVQFTAQVIECGETWVLVEPLEGEAERSSADRISFGTQNLEQLDIQVGTQVVITYGGEIMESYPAQIIPISWRLA
jgi:hypothetical protein